MSRFDGQLKPHACMGCALALAIAFTPSVTRAEAAGLPSSARAPTPIERESPGYPKAAQKRGIEGWVLLEFTVDKNGQVVAPHVVDASPPGVFDAAALEAITRWRYVPAMNGADAVAAPGVRVKLSFQLK